MMKNFYSKIKFIFLGLSFAVQAQADTLHLAAAGAAKEFVQKIAPEFKRQTGHDIQASFDTVGAQRAKIEAQSQAPQTAKIEIAILSTAAIQILAKQNLIHTQSVATLGSVQVGLAVPLNSPLNKIEDLKTLLLQAQSVAYADPARGATAGTHFAKVLKNLNIEKEMAHKTSVLPFGVEVIHAVAAEKFALGVSQSSEIVQHKTVRYLGALPPPHNLGTDYQVAATQILNMATSRAAQAFLEFLATPIAQQAMRESGFEKP